MRKMNAELIETLVLQQETGNKHLPYENELEFFDLIKCGDIERLKCTTISLTRDGLGKLSSNPFRNALYHLIIAIALTTRFCIENGLTLETAYTLSDLYIQKADRCTKIEEIEGLHRDMIFDFAGRMKAIKLHKVYSKNVLKCIDSINDHIHEKVTIAELASQLNLSVSYLCTLFKKETGLTIAGYIQEQKIEAAKNLLTYSDYSNIEIANYLNFNSQSHFIYIFKKYTKMTPKEYRNKYFRSRWKV